MITLGAVLGLILEAALGLLVGAAVTAQYPGLSLGGHQLPRLLCLHLTEARQDCLLFSCLKVLIREIEFLSSWPEESLLLQITIINFDHTHTTHLHPLIKFNFDILIVKKKFNFKLNFYAFV